MARRQLSYSELRVAIFVLATAALLIVGIFYVTGQSAWKSKYMLKTYLPEADTLVEGAQVSLGGVLVGNVAELRVNPSPATPDENIEVDLRIYTEDRDWIRANSTATLLTQGALGSRYVSLTRGTAPFPVIPPGGTIKGVPASSIDTVVAHSDVLIQNLNGLATDLRSISDQIHEGKGTIGELVYSDKLAQQLESATGNANEILAGLRQGQGSAGKLLTSDEMYDRANSAVGRLDSMLTAVEEQKGTLGKMIYNPAFYDNANGFLAKGNSLLSGAEAGKGTLGQLVTNRALFDNLKDASANLRDVTGKLSRGQGTAGRFFTDPKLYDNLTGLSGDLRLLIGDFRKNPKKYLRIRVTIF